MNKLPSDIKEYTMQFGLGSEKGSIALATQIDPMILIDKIKELNPSFSLVSLLSAELEYQKELNEVRKRIAYQFYVILDGMGASVEIAITPSHLKIETDCIDIDQLFGSDLIPDLSHAGRYYLTTGIGNIVEDRLQFLRDLYFIVYYGNRDRLIPNDLTYVEINYT